MALKKLTEKTRWDIIDGEVYIFARKPGGYEMDQGVYLPPCDH